MARIEAEDEFRQSGRLDFQVAAVRREVFLLRYQVASFVKDAGWDIPELKDMLVTFDMDKAVKQIPEKAMTDEEYAAHRKKQVEKDSQVWCAALGVQLED